MNQTQIMDDRKCRKCSYELRGLRVGGVCPECGEPIRAVRRSLGARDGRMTEADPSYVKSIRLGFRLMCLGIVVSIAAAAARVFMGVLVGGLGSTAASGLWCWGVFIIARPRPEPFCSYNDPILDDERMRLLVRACGLVWVIYTLASLGFAHTTGLSSVPFAVLMVLSGLGAYLSLIPMCIYVGDMAFWMSDDSGGWRLRAAAWTMAVCGTLLMLIVGLSALGLTFLNFVGFWISIVVFVAECAFAYSVFQCALLADWVLRYQDQIDGRQERITERVRERIEHPGVVSGETACRKCGYDIRGLPHGGRCPECGTSFADITPFPIFKDRPGTPDQDIPIEVEESVEHKPIIPRRPSFGPLAARDDDAPIPLAGDDPDLPEDMMDPPAEPGVSDDPGADAGGGGPYPSA